MTSKTHLQNLALNTFNGYSSESSSCSPPSSPRRPGKVPHHRRRYRVKDHLRVRPGNFFGRVLSRRNLRIFILLPLLYISYLLILLGIALLHFCTPPPPTISISAPTSPPPLPQPGSVYRSHEVFQNLWPDIQSDNVSGIEDIIKCESPSISQSFAPNCSAVLVLVGVPEFQREVNH
uniref:Uncharacterized protein n=1 Tax=Nelumbo nucifera TaxID=4432 RepID=A0A822XWZ0_NELNU|nr:TPA_asm: hypothetical protein HUJ06_025996 [Nelumbo nucifera]